MKQYLDLLKSIRENGCYKPAAREGMPGTQSLFGYQFRHNLSDGFPVLTTKKMYWKGIVIELLWFLRGDVNIKYLDMHGVRKMWHEDAYNYYCKIAKVNDGIELNDILQPVSLQFNTRTPKEEYIDSYSMFTFEEFCEKIKSTEMNDLPTYKTYTLGDCGYQYGKVWRDWEAPIIRNQGITSQAMVDQIRNVINSLKNNPEGRRHIVTAIDPAHDTDLALYWCHAMFQFNCRPLSYDQRVGWLKNNSSNFEELNPVTSILLDNEKVPKYYLDCQLYQRSADVILGVPFNIASYALLTHILAELSNMIPGEFIHTFGDVHIYDNHKEAVEEQLSRIPGKLPKLKLTQGFHDCMAMLDSSSIYPNAISDIFTLLSEKDFILEGYEPQSKIEAELSTGLKK
jgi:thymidylate synthase